VVARGPLGRWPETASRQKTAKTADTGPADADRVPQRWRERRTSPQQSTAASPTPIMGNGRRKMPLFPGLKTRANAHKGHLAVPLSHRLWKNPTRKEGWMQTGARVVTAVPHSAAGE
jgi:hypothetical protein